MSLLTWLVCFCLYQAMPSASFAHDSMQLYIGLGCYWVVALRVYVFGLSAPSVHVGPWLSVVKPYSARSFLFYGLNLLLGLSLLTLGPWVPFIVMVLAGLLAKGFFKVLKEKALEPSSVESGPNSLKLQRLANATLKGGAIWWAVALLVTSTALWPT